MPRDQRDISVTFDKLKQEVAAILHQRDELLIVCKVAQEYILTFSQNGVRDIVLGSLDRTILLAEGGQ